MSMENRLRPEAHSALPWRLHEIASDFDLIDAWALPAIGRRDQFPLLLSTMAANLTPVTKEESPASAALFDIRRRLGNLLGWDDPRATGTLPIPGCSETSLRQRLPAEFIEASDDVFGSRANWRPVFVLDDEAAVEFSNNLLHAIVHLGWVAQSDGQYCGQMGIYVKHRGSVSRLYMQAIAPFRHLVVYPAFLKRIGKSWNANVANEANRGVVNHSEAAP